VDKQSRLFMGTGLIVIMTSLSATCR
jgi:hypothetical protein